MHAERFRAVPLLARLASRVVNAVTQMLKDVTVTHLKCQHGHIFIVRGTLPTHCSCRPKTANALNLVKLINNGIIPKTLMYCVVRTKDVSAPSLETLQRLGI